MKLREKLKSGDTLVADAYYCTYWLIAACHAKGVHVVMKNHDKRDDEPDDAKRISKYQRRVLWHRPQRPDWMSQEEYDALPEEVEIRLVDLIIDQRGFRSSKFTVATTILNTKIYSRQWITNLYRGRWLVELDIRSIKCSLSMDIIRAKSPDMVRTEIWSCLLAYNLIRLKMLQAAAVAGRMPRSLSFTATMQSLATTWTLAAVVHSEQLIQVGLEMSSDQAVAQRPDRVEPRANKRRPKLIALLTKPRQKAIAELKQTT